jgi:replicative DNA helicase
MSAAEIPLRRSQAATSGRVPPNNLQAEESLLGAMLLSKDAIAIASERLRPDDFYKPAHGHIYDAITALSAAGEPADPVTVADELRRAGLLDAIGGPATLVNLQAGTPATSNAGRYAKIIEDHALLRRMIGVAGEIAELSYDLPDDVAKAVDHAESMVFEVAQRRVVDSMAPIHDLLDANLDRLEQLYERGQSITGVPTGFTDLDDLTSGLQPNALYVVGARPSAGKTALALCMASNAALELRRPVLVFSLEMGQLELTQRMLCSEARVDSKRIRNGNLTEADWGKIAHATGRLADAPIWIDDNPNLTIMEIRSKARRLKSRVGDLGLIVVDYLQLMTGRSSAENRQVEVSEISRGLKILARELECPVMALSQLSRQLEMRADKRPMLADLRESGCLTADTRILRADTGAEVTMGELVESGERDIPVWTLDEDLKMVMGTMTHAFSSGVKEVFELRLASGRTVKASANHPFLTIDGWQRLDELYVDSRIAVPRVVHEPKDAHEWPEAEVIMLAHLIGDGCVAPRQPIHYTSADSANVDAVVKASAHFGVTPRVVDQETWQHVYLPSPRRLARGTRNPIAEWLGQWGLYGKRSYEKFVPTPVFSLVDDQLALFVRHLWATDGSVTQSEGTAPRIYYASTSERLAQDLQLLLTRFEIQTRLSVAQKGSYRRCYQLDVVGPQSLERFLVRIGVHGERGVSVARALRSLDRPQKHSYVDSIPIEIWERVRPQLRNRGQSARSFAHEIGLAGGQLFRSPPSRERLAQASVLLEDPNLERIASADILWDRVVSIVSVGSHEVFDATVAGTHNFVAGGVTVENSIEQDADVVMFIYRDEVYNPESADRGTAEIIVAKHRNGPTGVVRLAFLDHYTKFANMAKSV